MDKKSYKLNTFRNLYIATTLAKASDFLKNMFGLIVNRQRKKSYQE